MMLTPLSISSSSLSSSCLAGDCWGIFFWQSSWWQVPQWFVPPLLWWRFVCQHWDGWRWSLWFWFDYRYGDEHPSTNMTVPQSPSRSPKQCTQQRSVRRNPTVIRKDDNNPFAVAEYLLGGRPLMSDRDLETSVNPAAWERGEEEV